MRQAFAPFLLREELEDGEALELLSPVGFLEGVKALGVTDLEEVEVACLMRVLTKADLENAILLRELVVIMDNFGIKAEEEAEEPTEAKKTKKKKAEKPLDLSQLDEKAVKILAKLMIALMELNVSLYDFFEGLIYEQAVKTKTKQNTVEIMNVAEFFAHLQKTGVRKSDKVHESLAKFLQLDPNYPNLLLLKKLARTLDEMAKNEELMAGIFGEGEPSGEKRLVTIGEDGEYDSKRLGGATHNGNDDYEEDEDNDDDDE